MIRAPFDKMIRDCSAAMGAILLLALGIPAISQAADEAERQVWLFRNNGEAMAWTGNGPLPHGAWPVREGRLQLTASSKGNPSISKQELMLPAEQVNVVQLQLDVGPAKKCRFFFTTDVSPRINAQKMVEFDLKPDVTEYNVDLKALPAWNNQVTVLRFDFLGLKEGETVGIKCIKVFLGEKISTPMVYTAYRPGEKPVVREFRAASLFNSNMVLQRDHPLPVWGRAKPGASVVVRFADQTRNATTDAHGKWSVTLDAVPASAEPRTLEIAQATETLSFTNVVVGDVWLCGGQSNMGGTPQDKAPPAERRKELLETDYPNFRFVSMPSLHRETPLPNDAMEEALTWNPIRASALRGVSAVSYYFGQTVHTTQKIPVGLVFVIKAGSQVEQWLSSDELRRVFPGDELQKVAGRRLASGLHNGMIAPIVPFPLRGAIWYQGESNADDEFKYMGYYRSLPALVREWRRLWGEDLPVMLAQLPAYVGYPTNSWAHIREAQLLTSQRLPNVGLAVTFDEGDPTNLHPANKYFIGTRLGLAARAIAYGEKIEHASPAYLGLERKGNTLSLRFTHVAGGLKARGELTGFEVRGADQTWVPATAAITGKDGLIVSSPIVSEPQAARYAWKNNPVATLFNSLDLPASPFQTAIPEVSEFSPEAIREMTRKVADAGAMPSVLPEVTGATGAARVLSVMKTIRAIEVATNVVERKALEAIYVAQVSKIGTTIRTDGLWGSGITNGAATGVAPDVFVSALNVKVLAWGINHPIKMMWLDSHRVPVIRGWRALCHRVAPDGHLQAEGMNPGTERLAALAFQLAGKEVEQLAAAILQPMPFVQTAEYQQDLADQKRLLAEAPPATLAQSLELMRRACGWQQEHLFTGRSSDCHDSDTCWFRGTLFAGVVAAYRATKEDYYKTLEIKLGEKNSWKPGPNALRDGNDFAITQSYLDLFLMEKKPEWIAPTRAVMDQLLAEQERQRWGWCDALFMAPAAFARMSVATGDARYRDWMHRQWWQTVGLLYDSDEHLFVRDRTYLPFPDGLQIRERNGKKVFWGRGNGWVFGGLCRVLEALPADDPQRTRYEQLLREMAEVLITAQGKDGLWRASLQDPESYPLGETSGSTFFCYGLAWGINHRILDKQTYQPAVMKAWQSLLACIDPDGKLGFVQQPADSPRSATYRRTNSEYATGALLLAGSEVLRLL